jgi:hypothetical protein
MGTTLTGTTPQDTYDSLIKVTDNGPISGTAKFLSDGLGNDSALALSTTAVGIGTATPAYKLHVNAASDSRIIITDSAQGSTANDGTYIRQSGVNSSIVNQENGTLQFGTNNSFVQTITAAGNVGIGTTSPTAGYKLDLRGRAITYNSGYIADFISTESNASSIQVYADNTQASIVQGGTASVPLTFFVGGSEKMRIQTGGGISFNGDTAAANALDDYEEGTFTPVFTTTGTPFDQASSGTGKYTKIGNSVTIAFNVAIGGVVSGGTGNVLVTGLPFTSNASTEAFGIFAAGRITLSADDYSCQIPASSNTLSIIFLNSGATSTQLPASDVNGNTTPFFSTSLTYLV